MRKSRGCRVIAVLGIAAVTSFGLVACGSGESSEGTEGGTLRAAYAVFPESMDPQLAYTAEGWNSIYNTYIPLLTYAHAEDEAGSEVVPGLAKSLPEITNGGKTYTLELRQGLKYSDGRPVKASDFKYSVERMFRLNSGGSAFYTDIAGAEDFQRTRKGGISGIETDDRSGKITIDLVKPRGPFTNELAMPFVALVPPGSPDKDATTDPPPATGPYAISSVKPGQSWSYERNPEWLRNNAELMPDLPSGHVDRIEVTVIRNQSTEVNEVEQGRIDVMLDPVPPDRLPEVKQRFEGTQFRTEPSVSTYFFWMNTTQPPFDDVEVRKAVNHAVDPEALSRISGGTMAPTQQILPPGMPGYEKFVLYPHDMAKAEAMIAAAAPSDREVTVWTDNVSPNLEAGEYYEDLLSQLGFETTLKTLGDNYFTTISNLSTPELDTGFGNWSEDYPHPNDFFEPLLDGDSIAPTFNTNLSQMDEPSLNRKIAELATKQLDPELESQYASLDREFMELAPMAPYGTRTLSLFVSDAIDFDSVIWNPTFSADFTSFRFK